MPPPGGVAGIREAFSRARYVWLFGDRGNTSERIAWTWSLFGYFDRHFRLLELASGFRGKGDIPRGGWYGRVHPCNQPDPSGVQVIASVPPRRTGRASAAEPSRAGTRSGNIANYPSGANYPSRAHYIRTDLTITGIPRRPAWLR